MRKSPSRISSIYEYYDPYFQGAVVLPVRLAHPASFFAPSAGGSRRFESCCAHRMPVVRPGLKRDSTFLSNRGFERHFVRLLSAQLKE